MNNSNQPLIPLPQLTERAVEDGAWVLTVVYLTTKPDELFEGALANFLGRCSAAGTGTGERDIEFRFATEDGARAAAKAAHDIGRVWTSASRVPMSVRVVVASPTPTTN